METWDEGMRVAIIGLGRVAWELEQDPLRTKPCSHWGAWRQRPDVRVVAGCDLDPAKRAAFAAANPQASVHEDFREMLDRTRPELVSICAYADRRAEMVAAATAAGVRGIWCEKAMASSLEEVRRIEESLSRSGARMIVSFMRRWAPAYVAAAALIREGAIGRLESVNCHFSSNMLHTGTHVFDVLRMWCGEVTSVQGWLDASSARARDSGYRFQDGADLEDFGGFGLLHFPGGVRAAVHAGDKGYFRFEFEVLGSHGMLRLGNAQQDLWRAAPSPRYSGFRELERVRFPPYPARNMWRSACDNLVDAVRGRAEPACHVGDGGQALAIALALHLSHREGHRPVAPGEVPPGLRVVSR
jgi:predicted dehydrogenase